MKKITPSFGKLLISPLREASSSFSTESKKYERISIGTVLDEGRTTKEIVGKTVIFDDSHSVDFTLDGEQFMIIDIEAVVAIIGEEE